MTPDPIDATPTQQKREQPAAATAAAGRRKRMTADKPRFNSEDLLLLAHDEWKRREERKHKHNEQDWLAGFLNGFCTSHKWARERVDIIRANSKSTKGGAR